LNLTPLIISQVEDLRLRYFTDVDLVMPERLQLYRRCLHVLGEADRVYRFRDLCRKAAIETELGIEHGTDEDVLKGLGEIMNESQASIGELYENSCPEIDELVSICKANGALGVKMTGVGWGGCTISLVREKDVDSFVAGVRKAYHEKRFPDKPAGWLDDAVFATGAGVGGGVAEAADLVL
jgi:galactokinase